MAKNNRAVHGFQGIRLKAQDLPIPADNLHNKIRLGSAVFQPNQGVSSFNFEVQKPFAAIFELTERTYTEPAW